MRSVRSLFGPLLFSLAASSPAAAQCAVDELMAPVPTSRDGFGRAVATGHDFLAIGSPYHDEGAATNTGGVFVYVRDGAGDWVLVDELENPDPHHFEFFGASLAVDGDTIVVAEYQGAPTESVWVYERDDAGTPDVALDDDWIPTAELTPTDGSHHVGFGWSVAADGGLVMVGAAGLSVAGHTNAGGVWFYQRDDAGTPGTPFDDAWIGFGPLLPPEPSPSLYFGITAALDGTTAVVSTPHYDAPADNSGVAWVYERDFGGTPFDPRDDAWVLIDELGPQTSEIGVNFGADAAIDGRTIVVGAPGEPGAAGLGSGGVHVYQRDDNGTPENGFDDFFTRTDLLQSVHPETTTFGDSIALDVHDLIVGAVYDGLSGEPAGAAHVLRRDDRETPEDSLDDAWSQVLTLLPADPSPSDFFGEDVAIGHGRALVSSGHLQAGYPPGVVTVYDVPLADPLDGAPDTVSTSVGGTVTFTLDVAGCAYAGDIYLLLGSASGTTPGFVVDGFAVPLNPDPYFLASAQGANGAIFVDTLGPLDAAGNAQAWLVVPPALAALAGLELEHAFVVVGATTGSLRLVSNTEAVLLEP